jgi:hypothetical protein
VNHKRMSHRQAAPVKTCLFCETAGPLTGEHIFGDWLHKLGFNGEGVREISAGDGTAPIIQKGGPFTKKLPIVCGTCNNGWMSLLEEAAKPLLVSLFNAAGTSIALDAEAQLILARWAFKTAAVAAQVTRRGLFPQAHRREFYADDRPPRRAYVRIGVASIPTRKHGLQLAEYRFEPTVATATVGRNTLSFPFYRATFRLLTVVFDVFGYVTDDVELEIEPSDDLARTLLPLWPAREPTIWWPPTVSVDVMGGVPGLTASEVICLPTFVPAVR